MGKFKSKLSGYFVAGLLAVVPLVVSFWVVTGLINWVDRILRVSAWTPFYVPGMGLVLSLLFIVFVGVLVRNFIGRWLIDSFSQMIQKLPFIGTVYETLRQFMSTMLGESKSKFGRPVLVEFPRPGAWAIGFVTSENTNQSLAETLSSEYFAVFVPTTPNPTSGFMVYVRESEIKRLPMPAEQAFRILIALGTVDPRSSKK